ncbi:hypothetical protein [Amycolatopsis sp. NBC_00438]|uniref:hypothetical protein n=1 Tax=Amycolatopsis sp. NBC_00438 TaxID=2903558 RepID=UPI002E1C7BD6
MVDLFQSHPSHSLRRVATGGNRSDQGCPAVGQVEPGLKRGVALLALDQQRVVGAVVVDGVHVFSPVHHHVRQHDELTIGHPRRAVVDLGLVNAIVCGASVTEREGNGSIHGHD